MDPAAVRSFCDATGATEAQAAARLQAFGGNVEAAVNSFFGERRPEASRAFARVARVRRRAQSRNPRSGNATRAC